MASFESTVEALGIALAAGTPVLLWGGPGTGKSSTVYAVGDTLRRSQGLTPDEFPIEVVIASIHEPSDFGGLPIVDGDAVRLLPPRWAVRLAKAGRGLLFLDEISTAPPAVQAALLRVVLERSVGDLDLPDGVAIVAAANPPDMAAGGWDLTPPLANRFCHLEWTTDGVRVANGILSGFDPPVIPVLPSDWLVRGAAARASVAGFLLSRPAHHFRMPKSADLQARGWPTPRSWDVTARLAAACFAIGASEDARNALVIGCLGEAVAIELITFLDNLDLPNPELILADTSSFRLPERGDQVYAVLASIAGAVVSDLTEERWRAGWRVLASSADQGAADVAAMAARVLALNRPPGAAAPPEIKRFLPVLQRAGLIEAVPAPR